MLGNSQLQLLDTLENECTDAPSILIDKHRLHEGRHNDGQCLALIRSLAGDMPLRLAAMFPNDRPSVNGATMRMNSFTRFYPSFAGVALFDMAGNMITSNDSRHGLALDGTTLFAQDVPRPSLGITEDDRLASMVSHVGGRALVHADVKCPRGTDTCGLIVARLH
ncbi:hypothetical protein KCG44_01460 [Pacificimonas sp. WHA3]|uniref:Uncharacterized protein n=1 Tax=Pacificimonas pallii TaxID=2827236 RepID=A0ABS6SAT3_9SPHN|nr:hypothetical protein [Pacificimonas pallii]MBV7255445.1 hypothetical protein [Pacificimonas pallii]